MIYGRCGQEVTILRVAMLTDVERLDGRKPDKQDREALKYGSYVVVSDAGKERLYHQAFLRADDGAKEIGDAIRALTLGGPPTGSSARTAEMKRNRKKESNAT